MIVVSDTSAISNLLQIDLVDLLHDLYEEIIIPPAVSDELYQIENHEVALSRIKWIKTVRPENQVLVHALSDDLDKGESEAIALAIELDAEYLIIDEFMGRYLASEKYHLKIVGVLGILIQAKKKGLIDNVKTPVSLLRHNGFRLNQALVDKVLSALGEE